MPRKRLSRNVPSPGTPEFSVWFGQQLADHTEVPNALIDVLWALPNIKHINTTLRITNEMRAPAGHVYPYSSVD
jgi:hypothetical protein